MTVLVRPATKNDQRALGAMAGELVRMFHSFDPERFMPGEGIDDGYGAWLVKESRSPNARVLVAEAGGAVVGYAYSKREPKNWHDLIDEHGKLHDLLVVDSARRSGAGRALVERTLAELRAMGCERIVLSTAVANERAQKFFASLGFRQTMVEFTAPPAEA